MFLNDPNEAIRPDYTSDEHQQAREQLTLTNNANKQHWALRQERLEMVHQREVLEEEQRQQAREEEDEAARLEEHKKNKSKYAPFAQGKVPSEPTILPAPYVTRKMKSGDYCELHYFTNHGLDDVRKLSQIAEPDALVMLPSNDGIHSWFPADTVKDPKAAAVMKDENLTWEEFNEAAPRMINFMKMHDWLNERVTMHVQFWSALQTHCWRHASDHLKQQALLLYQSQQWRRTKLEFGGDQSRVAHGSKRGVVQ
ncbi:uncharacterized protein EDB91DRAFT_1239674 [Suillus paluster]|uniref:uncharacterized protein n=1 Tax=Suillus paluster TaxID=48578 RepID=UPI001B86CBC7|nr:uncharacterized protein EDB91DRAFT_1239674 [Suillus paluster]KAG1726173.1 hypothetical protein EDB91DRAFT_1239674 [Suillus paluster]